MLLTGHGRHDPTSSPGHHNTENGRGRTVSTVIMKVGGGGMMCMKVLTLKSTVMIFTIVMHLDPQSKAEWRTSKPFSAITSATSPLIMLNGP